jgi:hypothetical protein
MENSTKDEFAEKLAKATRVMVRKGDPNPKIYDHGIYFDMQLGLSSQCWFVGVTVEGSPTYQRLA